MYNLKKSVPVLLLLTFALAPAAHAESIQISRSTGVGFEIADQGNRALLEIRAESLKSVLAMRPSLPAQPVATSAPPRGIAMVATTGMRCAK